MFIPTHDFRYLDQTSSNCPSTKNSDSFTVWISPHLIWNLEVNTLGQFVSLHMMAFLSNFFKLTLRWLFYLGKVSFDVKHGVYHFRSCVPVPMIWVLFGPNFHKLPQYPKYPKNENKRSLIKTVRGHRGGTPHLIDKSSIPSFL